MAHPKMSDIDENDDEGPYKPPFSIMTQSTLNPLSYIPGPASVRPFKEFG